MFRNITYNFLILAFYFFAVGAVPADVYVYFIPQQAVACLNDLMQHLDRAQKEVIVASYWIFHPTIINKLIELRQKGIDVKVIFDSSTPNNTILIRRFLAADIIPVVAHYSNEAIMHNKFVVIDDTYTWSGSANFTLSAFAQMRARVNRENMLMITSSEVAMLYRENFLAMQEEVFKLYIMHVANVPKESMSPWKVTLIDALYRKSAEFKKQLINMLKQYEFTQEQKGNLCAYFPELQE